jgi:SAM-dependent methyltransferase
MAERDAVALYESLARFQWRRARRGVAPDALEGLELRKRLLPPRSADGPDDGGEGLDRWLRRLAGGCDGARVLDLGCGFGASLLRALDAGASAAVGITPSSFQVARADEVAHARGVRARATFEVRSMHAALPPADLVLAIEALGHTFELADVLHNVATALGGGGRFLWLEDVLRDDPGEDPGEDPDVRGLAAAWSSPPLRSAAGCDAALRAAGLRVVGEFDLTGQVARREVPAIDRSLRRLRGLLRFTPLPFARRILRAFVGGLHLERLYARGLACYRLVMTERTRDRA